MEYMILGVDERNAEALNYVKTQRAQAVRNKNNFYFLLRQFI